MNLLILGITIFFSIHLIPIFPLKKFLINRLGENKYKGLFSLIALIGILIIIYGFSSADYYPIWDPLPYSKGLALTLMPISIVLLVGANIQTNIKRLTKHPMLIGILIWSFVHLLSNGDLRSIILFVSFGVYALIDIIFSKKVLTTNNTANYTLTKISVLLLLVCLSMLSLFISSYIAGVVIF
jgi:uncharacterized membrane protein